MFSSLNFLLLVAFFLPVSKGSENQENEPFRMRKINLLWQKAKRLMLPQETLNELFVELQRQDRDEKKWKHQKDQGKDQFGDMEAVLRRNLMNIVDKYGLRSPDDKKSPRLETGDHTDTNRAHSATFIKDERLEKLWEHARTDAQFSKEELEDLRKELVHHHEKWKQYRELVNLVFTQKDNDRNVVGNEVPPDQDAIAKLQDEMNMQQQEVDRSYRRLKRKVLQGTKDGEFKDSRVRELWKRAEAQGLSEEELEVLKEELTHFDNKIAKHDHLREQLDVAEDLLNQGHEHIKAKHDKLAAKVKEHRRYIKKLHTTLNHKIGPRNEL